MDDFDLGLSTIESPNRNEAWRHGEKIYLEGKVLVWEEVVVQCEVKSSTRMRRKVRMSAEFFWERACRVSVRAVPADLTPGPPTPR